MLASSSSPEVGKQLRAERERLRLSLRDVKNLSRALADQYKNNDYYIAHSTLADIENGQLIPTIYKLYSLSVIYGRRYEQLATLFGIPAAQAENDHKALPLPRTYLMGAKPDDAAQPILWPLELRQRLRSEPTNLVSKMLQDWKEARMALLQQMDLRNSVYGYVGMQDDTLYPFIRPGSFVLVDPHQRKIVHTGWHNDFDRPVFFVELRDIYICSWCELQGSQLILIPAPLSRAHARHVRYPEEATIIGRVTNVAMCIAGERNPVRKDSPVK